MVLCAQDGENGHKAYELQRSVTAGQDTEFAGSFTVEMGSALKAGRALLLNLEDVTINAEDATALAAALRSPGCRVHEINAMMMIGDGRDAAAAAMIACSSVRILKYVTGCVCVCLLLYVLPLPLQRAGGAAARCAVCWLEHEAVPIK